MSFLDRIAECNNWQPAGFRPFLVAATEVGQVGHAFANRLADFPDVFRVDADTVRLHEELGDFRSRTAAVDAVLRQLADEGLIRGWRDEAYPIATAWGAEALLQMERAAVPFFGASSYGVHLNGFVRDGDRILMWIGRRARDKHTYPGMLDNTVAGGQPIGLSLRDNLAKEAAEEAAIPRALADRAVAVGAISYRHQTAEGYKPDVQFCYDLELPRDFVPHNTDGEIESFHLWPIEQVAEIVSETRDFKFNCNLVVIDFLVRHGILDPSRPDYLAIVRGLHR